MIFCVVMGYKWLKQLQQEAAVVQQERPAVDPSVLGTNRPNPASWRLRYLREIIFWLHINTVFKGVSAGAVATCNPLTSK